MNLECVYVLSLDNHSTSVYVYEFPARKYGDTITNKNVLNKLL